MEDVGKIADLLGFFTTFSSHDLIMQVYTYELVKPGEIKNARIIDFKTTGQKKFVELRKQTVVGQDIAQYLELVHPEDRPHYEQHLKSIFSQDTKYSIAYRVYASHPHRITALERGKSYVSSNGLIVRVVNLSISIDSSLQIALSHIQKTKSLKHEKTVRYGLGQLIGRSKAMQTVYNNIIAASSTDVPVILYGESGTGKEVSARTLHELSPRVDHPFIPVNCGSVPHSLFESEFFGHKKGSFTGAVNDHRGFIEQARKGTLFLDEVGELPLDCQAKLLRAIEGQSFIPVGGTTAIRPDVRIVAATNRNLREEVLKGRFRKDLFYRLQIIPIALPPLKKRKEDISLLVEHFLKRMVHPDKQYESLPPKIRIMLEQYDWPGNIRELQNALYRYLAMGTLDLGDSQAEEDDSLASPQSQGRTLSQMMDEHEKKIILEHLKINQFHKDRTAKQLHIDRKTLFRKIQKYKLGQ